MRWGSGGECYMLHDMQVIATGKKGQADPSTVAVATVKMVTRGISNVKLTVRKQNNLKNKVYTSGFSPLQSNKLIN